MAFPAMDIGSERSMDARTARLEATTEHIQVDMNHLRGEMKDLRQEMKEFHQETKQLIAKLDVKFEARSDYLQKAFESLKIGRVWDRVWMLLAMGTLLGVMARGFKWI